MSAVDSVFAPVEALGDFFKKSLPRLSVYREWPRAGEQMRLPAVSILSHGHQMIVSSSPQAYAYEEIPGDQNNVKVFYNLGDYKIKLQADIWMEYSRQRGYFAQKIENLFAGGEDLGEVPQGLALKMKSYFNIFCQYRITDYTLHDTPETSSMSEWRLTYNLTADFAKIGIVNVPKIRTINLNLEARSGNLQD